MKEDLKNYIERIVSENQEDFNEIESLIKLIERKKHLLEKYGLKINVKPI